MTDTNSPTEYLYLVGYVCPNGTFGRQFIAGPSRIETESDLEQVQIAVRRIAGEPTAFVLSVSLLAGPDGGAS